MFKFPYETTPCASYQISSVRKALMHALVSGELSPVTSLATSGTKAGETLKGVLEVPPSLKSIPAFSQPVWLDGMNREALVLDTRAFVSEKRDGTLKVTNPTEYRFASLKAVFIRSWIVGGAEEQSGFGDFPATVFSRILSEGLVRRLGLSPLDQMNVSVISAYYYFCLFLPNDTQLTENLKVKLASRVARATRVNLEKTLAILDVLPFLKDINDYLSALKEYLNTPRLDKVNVGFLYAAIGGVWFGAHARESVAMALEYPPVFLAMLYLSLTDRSYHRAYFTKTVLSTAKEAVRKDFTRQLSAYLNEVAYV